ncbi:hypothetical protein WICPIJ_006829 [Wickerhamomyces pijperi]|uniref:Uncharacterized protein n=1 Tax=Wickerhamomyces pijperi TaxID=599730 RepID=A0A9P8Q1E2_WICPI|nr:hypothetical protein WICPIJ_006829 [Wickerhamomyces pijperi]
MSIDPPSGPKLASYPNSTPELKLGNPPPKKSNIICIPPPPLYSSTSAGNTLLTPSRNQTLSFISVVKPLSNGHTAVKIVAAPFTWKIQAEAGSDVGVNVEGKEALANESMIRMIAEATSASVFSGEISNTASLNNRNASPR